MRATWLILIGAALVAGPAAAEDELPREIEEFVAQRILPVDEGAGMLGRFVERNLNPLPLPESAADWKARRDELRRRLVRRLGLDDLLPPAWPLAVQSRGTLERDGYRIEKITYESYPGVAVPALVYVPTGLEGKLPGIISIAGHVYADGKAADFLQIRNINLAKRGCVVLAYDYIGCGERNTGPDARGGKPYGGGNDHGIPLFSFSRRTPTGLEMLDAIRALDVLCARPDVAQDRLGFTGESGGGNTTYWAAALDERIHLAVPVSCLTSYDYWIRLDRNWDWHQRPFGVRRDADVGTLLALHAPRPLVAISSRRGTDDHEFPWDEADKSAAWAARVYSLLDATDAFRHVESTSGHGYQEDKRSVLYDAVERRLSPPRRFESRELPAAIESFATLTCGLPRDNKTGFDVYHEWLRGLPRSPDLSTEAARQAARRTLRELLGIEKFAAAPPPRPEVRATAQTGAWRAESWIVETEPGIRLPCTVFGRGERPERVTIVTSRAPELLRAAARDGWVLAVELRGTGETKPPQDAPNKHRSWSWFVGRPAVAQQAEDLATVWRIARERWGAATKIQVVAPAPDGFAGLLAGAIVEQPGDGRVELPFESFAEFIRRRGDRARAETPGLYETFDVPQLVRLWTGTVSSSQPDAPAR